MSGWTRNYHRPHFGILPVAHDLREQAAADSYLEGLWRARAWMRQKGIALPVAQKIQREQQNG